jgi:hypothetical protein
MCGKKADLGSSMASKEVWSTDKRSCCQTTRQTMDRLANRYVSAWTVQSGPRYGDFRTLTCCNSSCSDSRYSGRNKPGHVVICIVSCIPRGCNLVNMVWSLESLQTKRLSRMEREGEVGFVGRSHYECFQWVRYRVIRRTQLKRRRWGGRMGIIGNGRKQIKRQKE